MSAYTPELQKLVAHQIELEFLASHTYRGYGAFFNHPKVSYPGFGKYFHGEAAEELKHADAFIKYHQDRGEFVKPPAIPALNNEFTIGNALIQAIQLEEAVRDNLVKINIIADPQTQVFIQDYIVIQTDSIAELTTLLSKVLRVENDSVGLYLIDKALQ